ncbi:MAG TPA: hypothetical protein VJQ85_02160 [Gaiellaceae bacterium]|nr:hypothetical protein [Gaiellaceae bacterium]
MQRRGLGILFSALAAGFLLVAVAATGHGARGWVIAVAAAAIAVWFASIALSSFRRR